MQQIVLKQPGEFFAHDVPQPASPAAGEALIRVHRIGVCGTDLHAFTGKQPFFEYPRVLGHELGVEVVEVGANDRGIAVGDNCAVEPYMNCEECIACRRGKPNCCCNMRVLGIQMDGAMSPYFIVPVEKLHKSATLSTDELALVEMLGIGAHAVERAAPVPEDNVLVIGAGPIGLGVMQFAKAAGCQVTAMDISDDRLKFCQDQLGVAHTVNPMQGDAEEQLRSKLGGDLPTVLLDATGNPRSMNGTFELVDHGGKIVFVGLFQGDVTFNDPNFHRRELTLMATRNAMPETFDSVLRLMESGAVDTSPWITHRLGLGDVVDQFADLQGTPGLVKAMIEVEG